MGDKDLEKIIAGIGADEQKIQQKEIQLQKYKQMIEKMRKELDEKDQRIIHLEEEMKTKFDLPEDVEQLKDYIGQLRGEINTKDNQLEMAYGKIAELEAENKVTMSQMSQFQTSFEKTYSQIATIKTQLVEKQAESAYKDNIINEKQMQISNFEAQMNNVKNDAQAKIDAISKDWTEKNQILQDQMKEMEARYKKMLEDKAGDTTETAGQIVDLKTVIAEKENEIMTLTGTIKERDLDIAHNKRQLELLTQQYDEAQSKLQEITQSYNEDKSIMERKLREEYVKQRADLNDKIQQMEKENLDLRIKITDMEHASGGAIKQAADIKAKMDGFLENFNKLSDENKELKEKLAAIQKSRDELFEFKLQNESSIINLEKLKVLFQKEPFFKIFALVSDIGEVGVDEIKNALGVPTVTVQKYIQEFVKAKLFELTDSGKVTLVNK